MSGSGGYYKYRCKYWLTYNCPHWVWVNHAPCAHCLADGRDSDSAITTAPFRISREVYVPRYENGSVHYMIMDVVATSEFDSGWTVKDLPQPFPTSSGPEAVGLKATSGEENPKVGWTPSMD